MSHPATFWVMQSAQKPGVTAPPKLLYAVVDQSPPAFFITHVDDAGWPALPGRDHLAAEIGEEEVKVLSAAEQGVEFTRINEDLGQKLLVQPLVGTVERDVEPDGVDRPNGALLRAGYAAAYEAMRSSTAGSIDYNVASSARGKFSHWWNRGDRASCGVRIAAMTSAWLDAREALREVDCPRCAKAILDHAGAAV